MKQNLLPIGADEARQLGRALGLPELRVGRQVLRDQRGWKESEIRLDLLVVGSIRPASTSRAAFALGWVDGASTLALTLAGGIIGPVSVAQQAADALLQAWPAPWGLGEASIVLDGAVFDLWYSNGQVTSGLRFASAGETDGSTLGQLVGTLHRLLTLASGESPDLADWLEHSSIW